MTQPVALPWCALEGPLTALWHGSRAGGGEVAHARTTKHLRRQSGRPDSNWRLPAPKAYLGCATCSSITAGCTSSIQLTNHLPQRYTSPCAQAALGVLRRARMNVAEKVADSRCAGARSTYLGALHTVRPLRTSLGANSTGRLTVGKLLNPGNANPRPGRPHPDGHDRGKRDPSAWL